MVVLQVPWLVVVWVALMVDCKQKKNIRNKEIKWCMTEKEEHNYTMNTEGDEKNTIKCTQNKKETCLADVKARWWAVQRVALMVD